MARNKSHPFETTRTGFWMTFENGYSISVQWGSANYCTNRTFDKLTAIDVGDAKVSNTAEIAICEPNGSWHKFSDSTTCQGWCTPEQVLEWMEYCKSLPFVITQDKPEEGTITP